MRLVRGVVDNSLESASVPGAHSQPMLPDDEFLNCYLVNARSVCNKLNELNHLLVTNVIDILFITETWLNDSYKSSLLVDPTCYSVLRKDRPTDGGGVCAIIKSGIDFLAIEIPKEFENLELLAFDVLGVHTKYRFIVVYRAPDSNAAEMLQLIKAINFLCSSDASVVLCGDFNLPGIDWNNIDCYAECNNMNSRFIDCMQANALSQYVDVCTRGNNILDLVFTNDPFLIYDVHTDVPLSTGDHDKIVFKLYFPSNVVLNESDKIFTDFSHVDWQAFNEYFSSVNWSTVYSADDDGDARWAAFSNTLNNAVLQFAETSIKHVRRSAIRSYPAHIRKLISKKKFLWRKSKHFKTKQTYKAYRESAQAVRKAIYAYTCQLETNLIDSNNIGAFYRYVNKKLSSRSGVGCLKRSDGSVTNDPKEKAELLNNYFSSVFTTDDGCSPSLPSRVAEGVGLSTVSFTAFRVAAKLRKLKPATACGPDGIQATLLRNASESLALPLAQLYEFLFNSHSVPAAWKLASVTAVFKKGKPSDVSNYRPISLTSLCCKIMESIIKDDMLAYLLSNGLINRNQHGFC